MRLDPRRTYYLFDGPRLVRIYLLSVMADSLVFVATEGLRRDTPEQKLPRPEADTRIETACRAKVVSLEDSVERFGLPFAPPEIQRLGRILAGETVPEEPVEDYRTHVVTVRAKSPPLRRTCDNDPWSHAEDYGTVEHDASGEPWVYVIHGVTGSRLKDLCTDARFEIRSSVELGLPPVPQVHPHAGAVLNQAVGEGNVKRHRGSPHRGGARRKSVQRPTQGR